MGATRKVWWILLTGEQKDVLGERNNESKGVAWKMYLMFSKEDPGISLLEKQVGLYWWQYSQEWFRTKYKFQNEDRALCEL